MRGAPRHRPALTETAYLELVRSLFATLAPTAIMGSLFIVVASMATQHHPDTLLGIMGWMGGAISMLRVGVLVGREKAIFAPDIAAAAVIRIERLFGATYLTFAVVLGLFAARVLSISDLEVQMVVGTLLVGYAAGVAAGVSLRPQISIPAVLAAVLPVVLSACVVGDAAHLILAAVLLALLGGGIGSMLARYRSEIEKIAMRQTFASLARTDHLTGLSNRLALTEAYDREVANHGLGSVVVHCLDLDRFKQVNDRLGHPAGDILLKQVADRLRTVCRGDDVAARLGGDEFVLLQTRIGHADEAELLARRIVRVVTEPYDLDGHLVSIGVSVGYAAPRGCGRDLGELLGCADRALYQIKRDGGGAAAHIDPAELGRAASA